MILISEAAVYQTAFRSTKPAARRFTEWVAGEVLPAIRKTGGYSARIRAARAVPETALRATLAAAANPAFDADAIGLCIGGRKPPFWSDMPVRDLAVSLHRQMTIDEARGLILADCGAARTPSRTSLHRFWSKLDQMKRARLFHPLRRSA